MCEVGGRCLQYVLAFAVLLTAAGGTAVAGGEQEPVVKRRLRDTFCQGKTHGLYAAPRGAVGNIDCRGYYNCFHGNEPMQQCSPGTRFDDLMKNCNWVASVQCSAQPPSTAHPSTQPPSTTTIGTTSSSTATMTRPPTQPPISTSTSVPSSSMLTTTHQPTQPPRSTTTRVAPSSSTTQTTTTDEAPDGCRTGPWSKWSACDCPDGKHTRSADARGPSSSSTFKIVETAACSCTASVFVGYFANWFQWWDAPYKFLPEDIQADKLTHLNFAFAMIHSQTYKLRHFEDNDIGADGLYRRANKLKLKHPHLKTLISVGGWSFNIPASDNTENTRRMRRLDGGWTEFVFSDMVSSPDNRKKFVDSAIDFCREWGFDGIDLDWEYPGDTRRGGRPTDKANFVLLLAELRTAFNSEGAGSGKVPLLLTAAVGVGPDTASKAYDVPALNANLDFMNLMTYDMYGPWGAKVVGIHSQLHAGPGDAFPSSDDPNSVPLSGSWAVDWWISQGALPGKLTLGLATYSRGFVLKSDAPNQGPGAATTGEAAPQVRPWVGCCATAYGTAPYYELKMLLDQGAHRTFDAKRCGAYLQLKNVWHGFDDEETMGCKAAYIKEKGLLGGILWDLPEDDFVNGSPLVTAFSDALLTN